MGIQWKAALMKSRFNEKPLRWKATSPDLIIFPWFNSLINKNNKFPSLASPRLYLVIFYQIYGVHAVQSLPWLGRLTFSCDRQTKCFLLQNRLFCVSGEGNKSWQIVQSDHNIFITWNVILMMILHYFNYQSIWVISSLFKLEFASMHSHTKNLARTTRFYHT